MIESRTAGAVYGANAAIVIDRFAADVELFNVNVVLLGVAIAPFVSNSAADGSPTFAIRRVNTDVPDDTVPPLFVFPVAITHEFAVTVVTAHV